MKVTYFWLIYSCLSFGIVIFCVRKLEKLQTVSSCIINPKEAFNCSNGQCIESSAVCDGHADCSDGSDETNDLCAKQACQSYEYRCQYGACVDKIKKCDGENDCVDGSDENLTECKQSSITRTKHINGSSKCLEYQYKCKSGQCIEGTSTCDGTRNCMDGSDEENCFDRNPISESTTLKPVNNATQLTTQSNTKKLCVLPTVEGVIYSYEDSDEIIPHGTLINHYRTIIENCEGGFYKAYSNSVRVCQGNGKWFSNSEKLCYKMCPPLISDSLNINCTLNGDYANCSNPSIPDTIAIPSCKPTYIVPTGQEETRTELLCQSNGTWNNQLYRCIPHCGRPFVGHQLLINNGKTAHVGAAPWNVGVYQLDKWSSNYNLICGGSIIASNLVVSAAHCFYQKNMLSNIISINNGLYKIAVGKYNRDLTLIENDFTQIMDVETIYLKKDYHGYYGFHLNDIAVIVLKNRVSISIGVTPVCVDWNNRYNVTNGTHGKIVGWGKTEKEISNPILLEATLPYIDHNSCRKMYTNGFQAFVTIDKFCAGSALDCGRMYVEHQLLIDNGKPAHVGTAPWNVGIYRFNGKSSTYDLICGGSIISPNLVVSAAHCFWEKDMLSNILSINDGLYRIAVGKFNRNYTVIDNDYTQIMDVETIYLNEHYVGHNRYHSNDIAGIILKNKITISIGVAPVCVDWNNQFNVKNGTHGEIVGWGKTEKNVSSSILLKATLPYIDHNSCRKMYTNGFQAFVTIDKFCAGSALGPGVREGDSGTGLTFSHSDFYYLTGIVSVKDPNTNNSIAVFTNFNYHIQWVRQLYNKYTSDDTKNNLCILPTAEGVIYSYEDSKEILSPGTFIGHLRTVIESCEVGYHKAYNYGFRFCDEKGEWISNSDKLCFKMCPPLLSDSLNINCTLNGNYVNCSNPSIPDTIAILSCKESHTVPINEQKETPTVSHCQSNGTWSKQLYRCISYCGKPFNGHKSLIDNGKTTRVGTSPWNVGIYRFNNESSKYELICGGLIIAANLVISAAHCFSHKDMKLNRVSINSVYKIAVGKYNRDLTVIDNDFTQIMDVETIYVRKAFDGPNGFYLEDLSIIVLKNKISISMGVEPVCVDWNGRYNVMNGTKGKIVGWGKTEKDKSSLVLLEANLSYIDYNSCQDMLTNGFQRYVNFDRFCAESALKQGVYEFDSGAGLTFLHSNHYYLTGVVIFKDSNKNNSITVFQDIKPHIGWIRALYDKHIS